MSEIKPTNPKDAIGIQKWRQFCTIPMTVMSEVGVAMMEGGRKYGRHNYRSAGVRASVYVDAAMGHIVQWWEGEDLDPDTGLSHITKAIASLTVLRDAAIQEMLTDDRPPKARLSETRDHLQAVVDSMFEKHPEPKPAFTELTYTTVRTEKVAMKPLPEVDMAKASVPVFDPEPDPLPEGAAPVFNSRRAKADERFAPCTTAELVAFCRSLLDTKDPEELDRRKAAVSTALDFVGRDRVNEVPERKSVSFLSKLEETMDSYERVVTPEEPVEEVPAAPMAPEEPTIQIPEEDVSPPAYDPDCYVMFLEALGSGEIVDLLDVGSFRASVKGANSVHGTPRRIKDNSGRQMHFNFLIATLGRQSGWTPEAAEAVRDQWGPWIKKYTEELKCLV